MAENFQIRDVFNPKAVKEMAARIKSAWPDFQEQQFTAEINNSLSGLTYSERSTLITASLEKYLPKDFPKAVAILLSSQLPPFPSDDLENTLERFITITNTAFISRNGLEYFDISLNALYEMTKRMTAEFDIRIFIEKFPEKTLLILKKWASDENAHVRRLVSEGSRPLLPWGKRLNHIKENPGLTLDILEYLKNDPSAYVRRSVANHLNDHAKSHPDLIIHTLKKWKREHPGKNMDQLIRHATRTLIKNGHAGALELIGFKKGAAVKVDRFVLDKNVNIGEHLNFSFDIIPDSKTPQKIVIDYAIYHKKADGTNSPKVFKLTTKTITHEKSMTIKKKHSFKKISTRNYYSGKHKIVILINGEEKMSATFNLDDK